MSFGHIAHIWLEAEGQLMKHQNTCPKQTDFIYSIHQGRKEPTAACKTKKRNCLRNCADMRARNDTDIMSSEASKGE